MKIIYKIFAVLSILLFFGFNNAAAQDSTAGNHFGKHRNNFVDKNGDGYNDNAPDHDGDGIPNGLDPDWQKLQSSKKRSRFVDMDGDGIDDNFQDNIHGNRNHYHKNKPIQKNRKSAAERKNHNRMRKHGKP
jgi:hypothetical protein